MINTQFVADYCKTKNLDSKVESSRVVIPKLNVEVQVWEDGLGATVSQLTCPMFSRYPDRYVVDVRRGSFEAFYAKDYGLSNRKPERLQAGMNIRSLIYAIQKVC